jgi:nucleoside phosphorylase
LRTTRKADICGAAAALVLASCVAAPSDGAPSSQDARIDASLVVIHSGVAPKQFLGAREELDKYLAELPWTRGFTTKVLQADAATPRYWQKARPVIYSFPSGKKIVLVSSAESTFQGAMIVSYLATRFRFSSLVYAGSCGVLSDRYQVFDILLPVHIYRSDYEYADPQGKVLFVPDWPHDRLRDAYLPFYDVDLTKSSLLKSLARLGATADWERVARQIVADNPAGVGAVQSTPVAHSDVVAVSGSQFVAGKAARRRYADYFKADAVEMRAHQIVQAGQELGIPVAVVLSCADLAGEDRPDDAFEAFLKNIKLSRLLYTVYAVAGVAQ